MKYSLLLCLLGAVIIHAVTAENAPTDEDASLKSSVPRKDSEKLNVDSETKEQLQESDNDDKELEKQKQDKESSGDEAEDANDEADSNVTEDIEEKSNQGPEESSQENEAENGDSSEAESDSVRRTEETGKSNKKKGRKLLVYPMFYPGDNFGAHHYQGGPAQFNPAGFWQYPYPFVHPMYPQHFNPCHCECNDGKDDDEKDDGKEKGKKNRRKQLVPTHLYGPPSAGWGGFQPGHTGAGWGAPYWYKSYIPSSAQRASRRFGIETAYQTLRPLETYANHYTENAHDLGLGHGGYNYLGGHDSLNYEGGDHVGYDWSGDGYSSHGSRGLGRPYGGSYGYSGQDYDLDNAGGSTSGWGNAIGHPYVPKHVHGHGGHHSNSDHHGQNHIDIHHGHAYFGHELAYQHLPTAQGHIQIASSGHDIGFGGHNLGGLADKEKSGHGTDGDFVGGIHTDLGTHGHSGHGHGHADYHGPHHVLDDAHADLHVMHPHFHGSHDDDDDDDELGLHGTMGDHFGSLYTGGHGYGHGHGHGSLHTGMPDHFGPLLENGDDGEEEHGGELAHGGHGFNERIMSDFGAHAGHGGAFDGHIGNSVYGHLIGGHHKSGVPANKYSKKEDKKPKSKAKIRAYKGRQKVHGKQEQLP